jgi:hypothetical protein
MKDKSEVVGKMIGVVLIIVGLLVTLPGLIAIMAILNGFVLSVLWGWFMVPVFKLPHSLSRRPLAFHW